MKKVFVALLALATALAITPSAQADTYTYDYTYTDGSLVATGTLTGILAAPGVYDITSGTIDLTGSSMNRTGILVPIPASGVFETGGGTNVFGFINSSGNPATGFETSVLFPGEDPQINAIWGDFYSALNREQVPVTVLLFGPTVPITMEASAATGHMTTLAAPASMPPTPTQQ